MRLDNVPLDCFLQVSKLVAGRSDTSRDRSDGNPHRHLLLLQMAAVVLPVLFTCCSLQCVNLI